MKWQFVSRKKYDRLQEKMITTQKLAEFRLQLFKYYQKRYLCLRNRNEHPCGMKGRFVKRISPGND